MRMANGTGKLTRQWNIPEDLSRYSNIGFEESRATSSALAVTEGTQFQYHIKLQGFRNLWFQSCSPFPGCVCHFAKTWVSMEGYTCRPMIRLRPDERSFLCIKYEWFLLQDCVMATEEGMKRTYKGKVMWYDLPFFYPETFQWACLCYKTALNRYFDLISWTADTHPFSGSGWSPVHNGELYYFPICIITTLGTHYRWLIGICSSLLLLPGIYVPSLN